MKKIWLYITVGGFIAYILLMTVGLGENGTVLNQITINNTSLWIIDFKMYFENLQNIGTNFTLSLSLPQLDFTDVLTAIKSIINILLVPINLLCFYPLRLGSFTIALLLSILGVNTNVQQENLNWLLILLKGLSSVEINYL